MVEEPRRDGSVSAPASPVDDAARIAGRGFLFIAFAKAYFMASGLALNLLLPRLLQRAAQRLVNAGLAAGRTVTQVADGLYGDYGLVNRFASFWNNAIVTSTIQSVSKYVAEDDAGAPAVRSMALRIQALIGGVLATVYALGAHFIAGTIYGDPTLTRFFRWAAAILLAYSIYSVFIGYLNGRRQFGKQASFDIAFATLKVSGMLGAALLGYGAGALFQVWAIAAASITVVAAALVGFRRGDSRRDLSPRVLLRAWWLIFAYTLVLNLLLLIDVSVLKSLAARAPLGLPADQVLAMSKSLIGIYYGVLIGANIPYQAVLAVAFVAFPLVSQATFVNDSATVQSYVRETLRYSLIFVSLLAVVFMASPHELLRILKPSFEPGGPALAVYVVGQVFFALFAIANTILIASGRMGAAILIGVVTAVLDLGANMLVVPYFLRLAPVASAAASPAVAVDSSAATAAGTAAATGSAAAAGTATAAGTAALAAVGGMEIDPVVLLASASATAPALAIGGILALGYLQRVFGATIPLATVVRVVIVAAAIVGASWMAPRFGLVVTLAKSLVVVIGFVVGLYLLKEFGPEDRDRLIRVLRRKGSS